MRVTRRQRAAAASAVVLALMLVVARFTHPEPADASATCVEVAYHPDWTTSKHLYIQGVGTMHCSGTITHMEIRTSLQRYYSGDATWRTMVVKTQPDYTRASSAGSIQSNSVPLPCLNGKKVSYRTLTRYEWEATDGNHPHDDLVSGYVTLPCGR